MQASGSAPGGTWGTQELVAVTPLTYSPIPISLPFCHLQNVPGSR